MVYIHGGAWMIGEKREQGKPMMYELVARGWVCVAINYRLSPKATWPDHIVDAKRAVAWVKEHIDEYGGDPSFVAVSGGSAGGHLCALLALSAGDPAFQPGFEEADTTVQACVPFYGVMDLTSSPEGSAIFGPGLLKMLEKKVMKTTESEHPEVFRAASPTYRVRAEAPPFFVLQGVNDTLVPVETARTFVDACGRCRANRSPMRSCPWPSTLLTSWRRSAARPPPRPLATSSMAARAARLTAEGPNGRPPRNISDIESPPKSDLAADRAEGRETEKGWLWGTADDVDGGARPADEPGAARRPVITGSMPSAEGPLAARPGRRCLSAPATPLAPAPRRPEASTTGITPKSVTVGSIIDISAPVAGLFEGADRRQGVLRHDQRHGGVDGRKLVVDPRTTPSAANSNNETQDIQQRLRTGGQFLPPRRRRAACDRHQHVPDVSQVLDSEHDTRSPTTSAPSAVTGRETLGPVKWLKKQLPQGHDRRCHRLQLGRHGDDGGADFPQRDQERGLQVGLRR